MDVTDNFLLNRKLQEKKSAGNGTSSILSNDKKLAMVKPH